MTIEEKIHLIQSAFQKARGITSLKEFEAEVSALKLNTPGEYVSVLYEGASAGIGLTSFKNTHSFNDWLQFYESYGARHSSQILVGLGWALFEGNQQLSPTLNQLEPRQIWRVLDGYGFCHGLFKRNASIRKQLIPKEIDDSLIGGYMQGLGRSLWYISRGNVDHLVRMIRLFSGEFHSALWRGVGIAVTYVGSVNELTLTDLKHEARSNLSSLKLGVALALHSREKSMSFSEDALFTGNFFSLDIKSTNKKLESFELQGCASVNEYNEFLGALEI